MNNLFEFDYNIESNDFFYLDDILTTELYDKWFGGRNVIVLNKNRCGNGGTTGIINYCKTQCKGVLILVPNVSITKSKEVDYGGDNSVSCVYGGVDGFDKDATVVVATYDQFPRMLKELSQCGGDMEMDGDMRDRWWSGRTIVIDEYHKLIDECGFRDICLEVTELIKKNFTSVVLMSATPHYGYIDFLRKIITNRNIVSYNVVYDDEISKTRINVYDVKKDIKSIIKKVKDNTQQTVVFYNSVDEIKKIIDHIGNDECEVLCSKDRAKELGRYYSSMFDETKKLHFLTSAYFTGCDINIHIDRCIIIGSRQYSHLAYNFRDIKQMIGRFRNGVESINLFYLDKNVDLQSYISVKSRYDNSVKELEEFGDDWNKFSMTIKKKQKNILYQETLERYECWKSTDDMMKMLEDGGYVVKKMKIGDFVKIDNRKKLTFGETKNRIMKGVKVEYDEYKYCHQMKEYWDYLGHNEQKFKVSSRTTILNWWKVFNNVGESDTNMMTPDELSSLVGIQDFGIYRGDFLMTCVRFFDKDVVEYDELSKKMYEIFNVFCIMKERNGGDRRGRDLYFCIKNLVKITKYGDITIYKRDKNIPEFCDFDKKISYHIKYDDKTKHCIGGTFSLDEITTHFSSLADNKLYSWVNEDKKDRLPGIKKSKEWMDLKNFGQSKISELYKDTTRCYRHIISQMDRIDHLILDIDGGLTLSQFKERYDDFYWVAYPTINNVEDDWNKFRVIIPLHSTLELSGPHNLKVLKLLRKWVCPYEDDNHQMVSYINKEDWDRRYVHGSENTLKIDQNTVDGINISLTNSIDLTSRLFDEKEIHLEDVVLDEKDIEWAKEYFSHSFMKGDGYRHKSLFVIKNRLKKDCLNEFEEWLIENHHSYFDKWRSHKIVNFNK